MRYLTFLFLTVLISCQSAVDLPIIDEVYKVEFKKYEQVRQEERDYYLKLCGLTPLPDLIATYGNDSLSDIQVEVPGIPKIVGYFSKQGKEVVFITHPNVAVTDENEQLVDTIKYSFNEYGNSIKLYHGRLSWMIITRGGAPYVRTWDEQHPAVSAFKSFDRFPLSSEFIFEGKFKYFDEPKIRTVSTQLGPVEPVAMIGLVTFNYNGKDYSLEVGQNGFTMVGDATTGNQTYGGGRYIDLELPTESGNMILDFNKLYNPPCTFSVYTTCQYPSEENVLPFELNAGELYSSH